MVSNKEGKEGKKVDVEESEPSEPEEIEEPDPHEKTLIKELEDTKKQLEETEETKKQLEETKKQHAECKDSFLRLSAEFENVRKRTLKEKEEFVKYANEKLILELIDIMENLERGLKNAKKAENKEKLIEGMELIHKQFKNVLEKNGLTPIKALGERFDPYKHEAMMQTITDEYEDGTILEEFARGYMLNNKVILYSKVRVSKRKEDKIENEVK
ncbi:nucleotide exchange factor GrpE [Candidatus Methanoperedens nitratireducens]|uniref:Protein GrpE n=1 Tax=Candidatus Methanoperedens nitratireducens TaxID=1392998 RepID=A0A284VNK7_9EURY|nr:nucleotide exchange factor GrpE [Candidatus Methanoperedens nitroreducens]SNQ60793.1 Protein GrpE [Candidatus Methanoperedens nitroreducens]